MNKYEKIVPFVCIKYLKGFDKPPIKYGKSTIYLYLCYIKMDNGEQFLKFGQTSNKPLKRFSDFYTEYSNIVELVPLFIWNSVTTDKEILRRETLKKEVLKTVVLNRKKRQELFPYYKYIVELICSELHDVETIYGRKIRRKRYDIINSYTGIPIYQELIFNIPKKDKLTIITNGYHDFVSSEYNEYIFDHDVDYEYMTPAPLNCTY